jgi:hypothetical protein
MGFDRLRGFEHGYLEETQRIRSFAAKRADAESRRRLETAVSEGGEAGRGRAA